ncbi:hypothetical protein AMECASPLE_034463 [Ameca splendens]|uniref:Uncharacterized protein n=1 Tax=Ameca splendens TaxID=208324 RepID=A0ABV0XK60_9TELE
MLSCRELNLRPSVQFFAALNRFSSICPLFSSIHLPISFPIPAEETYPHSMMLPPPSFIICIVCSGSWFSATYPISHVGQNVQLTKGPCSTCLPCPLHSCLLFTFCWFITEIPNKI